MTPPFAVSGVRGATIGTVAGRARGMARKLARDLAAMADGAALPESLALALRPGDTKAVPCATEQTARDGAPGDDRVDDTLANLLAQMLPPRLVQRVRADPTLLTDGRGVAEDHADCTVLFADLVRFTPLSEKLGPAETVSVLNRIVTAFDDIVTRHGVEKIKTIGDAYMAVAGLETGDRSHAERMAAAALEMMATIDHLGRDLRLPLGLRIGMAAGPACAGVIGTLRLSYDVWGSTVNLAKRMEMEAATGQIAVPHALRTRLADRFALVDRRTVALKGFGPVEAWTLKCGIEERGSAPGGRTARPTAGAPGGTAAPDTAPGRLAA